jgi:hypothetical protein
VTAAEIDRTDVRPVSTSVVRRGRGSSVFGIVAEGHARRRPSDIARVVIALVLVAIACAGATEVTTIEAAVFDLIATLPGGLEPVWNALYLLAPIVAGALLVTALVARRPRLLVTQAVAVGVAWLVGVALSATVDVPDTLSDAGVALRGHTPDFPVELVAASAAGLWASRPYLTRPARRMLEAILAQRHRRRRLGRGPAGRRDRQRRARLGRGCAGASLLRFPGGHAVPGPGG